MHTKKSKLRMRIRNARILEELSLNDGRNYQEIADDLSVELDGEHHTDGSGSCGLSGTSRSGSMPLTLGEEEVMPLPTGGKHQEIYPDLSTEQHRYR